MVYLVTVFWLAYSFDSDGVPGVLFGILRILPQQNTALLSHVRSVRRRDMSIYANIYRFWDARFRRWWPLGDHLVTTWWPLGDHVVTTWWSLGDHLVTTWWPLGNHFVTTWWPLGDTQFFVSSSSVLHQFSISSSSVLHQLFTISSSVLHHFFNSSSSILHHFLIESSRTEGPKASPKGRYLGGAPRLLVANISYSSNSNSHPPK